jgi:hypothetical protein
MALCRPSVVRSTIEKAAAKQRQIEHGGTAPGKQSRTISGSEGGDSRDKVGAKLGVSGKTYEKSKAVHEAINAELEKG